MKQIGYVLAGLLAGFILAGAFFLVARQPEGKPILLEPSPTKAPIEVHVIGAVVNPGVYAFQEGSRVQDAVNAAGGLLADADSNSINLAAKLVDGQQLVIPSTGGGTPVGPALPFSVIQTPSSSGSSADLVNINTATAAELDALPGIGPTTAQKIVDYRTQHGPFPQIEAIMNVPGIGPTTFDEIQNLISVH